MKKQKVIPIICSIIGLILSHIMVAHVSFAYRDMLCGIEHKGYSAPADVAYFYAIPYLLGIILLFIVAIVFWKKYRRTV